MLIPVNVNETDHFALYLSKKIVYDVEVKHWADSVSC